MRIIKNLIVALFLFVAVNSMLFAAKYVENPLGFVLDNTAPTTEAGIGFLYGKLDEDLYWKDPSGTEHNILLGGSTSLDNLDDVIAPTPSINQVLTFNGTDWVNQDAAGGVGKWVTAFSYFEEDVIWYEPELKFYVATADHTSGVFATDKDTNLYWSEVSAGLTNVLADGKIIVGSVANLAVPVDMSGEATIANTGAVTLSNSAVIGKVITGYTSGAGTVAATDTILQAINKLDGNDKAQDALSELNDVTLTLPAEGHHLEHNGTDWVNSDMQESAGLRTHPTLTDNGNGTVGLNSVEVGIRSDADHMNPIVQRTVPLNATITLTNNATNYIYVDYNAGSPIYAVTTDRTLINESNTLPVYRIYRVGTIIHSVDWDALANGLANKIHSRIAATDAFKYESGLNVADKDGTGSGLVITVSSGFAWHGAVRETLAAMDTSVAGQEIRRCYHVASAWDCSTTATGINNTQYDNGTNLVSTSTGRYSVNWLFRGIEDQTHLYTVLGTGNYNLTEAIDSAMPSLPELISSHSILIAKIIILRSSNQPTSIQVPVNTGFTGGVASEHNDLFTKQGGDGTYFYHLGLDNYERTRDNDALNYIKNYASNFEATTASSITSKWVAYDEGALARPVDMTAGTASTLTLSVSNTTPLLGTGQFSIVKSAADGQGEGVAYSYTVAKAHQTSILEVTFDYDTTSANYSCDATTTICDIGVYSYDGTNTYLIGGLPAGKGTFRGTFQTDSASTHRIGFHVQSTDATTYTVLLDNIVVKPQAPSVSGVVVTDWTSYTPTFTGLGTPVSVNVKYRRVGSNVEIYGFWENGTVTAASATFSLPSGLVTSLNSGGVVGVFGSQSTANSDTPLAIYANQSYIFFASGNWQVPRLGTDLATGAYTTVKASIPILGWSSNMVLSSSTSNREIYARYSKANVQTLATETIVDFSTPVSDKTNAVTTGAAWKFTASEDGTYTIEPRILPLFASVVAGQTAEMYLFKNGVSVERLDALLFHGTQTNKYVSMGKQTTIPLKKGDYINIRVTNGTSGLLTTANDVTFNAISIYKLNTGSQTIAKDTVQRLRVSASSGSINGSTPVYLSTFTDVKVDNFGAWTPSTSTMVAKRDGYLTVNVNVESNGAITALEDALYVIAVYIDNVIIESSVEQARTTVIQGAHGLKMSTSNIPVRAGQSIRVAFGRVAGTGDFNLLTTTNRNFISMTIED